MKGRRERRGRQTRGGGKRRWRLQARLVGDRGSRGRRDATPPRPSLLSRRQAVATRAYSVSTGSKSSRDSRVPRSVARRPYSATCSLQEVDRA